VGSVQWAHVGLAVACHSIRKHDAVRPILILSLERERAAVARELDVLVRHYAPLQVLPMTDLSKARMVARTCSYVGAATGNGTGGGMNASSDKEFKTMRRGTLAPMFNKFNVFALDKFARLLYLDTDVAVTAPLDQLWELYFQPHQLVAATHTTGWGLAICSKHNTFSTFNAGVFVLRPSAAVYGVLNSTMADLALTKVVSCSNGDQMWWNRLFAQSAPYPPYVRCIGHSWNCYDPHILNLSKRMTYGEGAASLCADTNTHVRNLNLHQQDPKASVDPHILHFALGSKPWRSPPTRAYYNAVWHTYRREMQSALLNVVTP